MHRYFDEFEKHQVFTGAENLEGSDVKKVENVEERRRKSVEVRRSSCGEAGRHARIRDPKKEKCVIKKL